MGKEKLLENTLDRLLNPEKEQFITGFEDLDLAMVGLEPGSLITVGGRPAMGKTTLLMSIFENALKKNKKCIYFSLNMSEKLFIERFLIQYAELNHVMVKSGKINEPEKAKLKVACDGLKNFDFEIICDWSSISIDEMEQKIENYNPDYVFIDYFQLLELNPKRDIQTEIKNLLSQIKSIANKNECYVFIASQLSRAPESRVDKRPYLSDLRGSSSLEELSDVVMFIYRDDYYHCYENDYLQTNRAEIIIPKNNAGQVGTVILDFKREVPKLGTCYDYKLWS